MQLINGGDIMANRKIKLRTMLGLIDEHSYLSLVITKNKKVVSSSEEMPCSKAIANYKNLMSYDVIEVSSDCDGILIISIEKSVG